LECHAASGDDPRRHPAAHLGGAKARDIVTKFEGVVTGRVEYMTGCNQLLITPEVKDDGAHRDSQWYDEQPCERIGTTLIKLDNSKTPGFDRQAPK
jgi:hypothetical protein